MHYREENACYTCLKAKLEKELSWAANADAAFTDIDKGSLPGFVMPATNAIQARDHLVHCVESGPFYEQL